MQLLPHLHLHHRVVRELLVQRGATGIAASSAAASVEGWQRRRRTQQALSWQSLDRRKRGVDTTLYCSRCESCFVILTTGAISGISILPAHSGASAPGEWLLRGASSGPSPIGLWPVLSGVTPCRLGIGIHLRMLWHQSKWSHDLGQTNTLCLNTSVNNSLGLALW